MGCTEKIGSVPFASLLATVICLVGIGVFCGTLYQALHIFLVQIVDELFHFKVGWLEVLQVVFIVIAVAMGVLSIILLVFGILATGDTRKNVYSGAKCIMGGRIMAAFFLCLSYLLNIFWMGIISFGVIPIIMYVSVSSICNHYVYGKEANNITYCFDLVNYGLFVKGSHSSGSSNIVSKVCPPTNLPRFCQRVEESGQLFCVSYAGSFLISLAMIHFMIILSSNYTRIKISKELTEYRETIEQGDLEFCSIVKSKSSLGTLKPATETLDLEDNATRLTLMNSEM